MTYSRLEEIRIDGSGSISRGYMPKELVDPNTGEVYTFPVRLWIPKGPRDKGNFVKVFDFFWEKVLRDKDIAKSAIRLWFWIIDRLDFNQTEIEISPKKVSLDLQVSERQVQRWIKRLCEKDIIRKIGRTRYKIPPYTVIKGNVCIAYHTEIVVKRKAVGRAKRRK